MSRRRVREGASFFVRVSEPNIRIHTSRNRARLAVGLVGRLRIRAYARKTIFAFFKNPLDKAKGNMV